MKTAIIVDPVGCMDYTPEDEIAAYTKRYERLLGRKLKVTTPAYVDPDMDAELVIYDFGGLMPGSDLMNSNARTLVQWAADHPNALVVIMSEFTYRNYVKYEAEELGLMNLPNMVVDNTAIIGILNGWDKEVDEYPVPKWFLAGLKKQRRKK